MIPRIVSLAIALSAGFLSVADARAMPIVGGAVRHAELWGTAPQQPHPPLAVCRQGGPDLEGTSILEIYRLTMAYVDT